MYGTIGHYHLKPGMREAALQTLHAQESIAVPGIIAVHVYQNDQNPDELMLVVMFENRATYLANANSPEQHERYLKVRQFLVSDPTWFDGEIIDSIRF
ncbi:MAG: antibiotic biosynthesis monooxygenase [Chloroflexi bacterium]|nr:antibiotic biosynthesis monooxygenase [Chloroflexota bacterium]